MTSPTPAETTAPIIILGVPRSGTTLLRTMLDAHPNIACGPETPWLGEHQPATLLGLVRAMREPEHGYCQSYGQPAEVVHQAARRLLDDVMLAYAHARGKRRWAEKTPNNVLHLDALHDLLPDAKWVWITRDALDVAHSTSTVAEHRRGVTPVYEKSLRLTRTTSTASTALAATLRWVNWNRRIESFLYDKSFHHLTYEQLVCTPEAELRRLCAFVDESFDRRMLEYDTTRHDLPKWEWGSTDVRHHGRVVTGRIGGGLDDLDEPLRDGLAAIASLWSPPGLPRAVDLRTTLPVASMTAKLIGEQADLLLPSTPPRRDEAKARIGEVITRIAAEGPLARPQPMPAPLAPAALALALAGVPTRIAPAGDKHLAAIEGWVSRFDVSETLSCDAMSVDQSFPPRPSVRSVDPNGLHTPVPAPTAVVASLDELRSEPFRSFTEQLDLFAGAHGFRALGSSSSSWECPWLWLHAIEPLPLAGLRVIDVGSELSPMPWLLATMGARVTLVETARGMEDLWAKLRERLNVRVDWVFTDDEIIPAPDAQAHLLTSLSVIEHQRDKKKAMDEIARVLCPGGVLAMSFGVCEEDQGMHFPDWNGRALTMAEFERDVWHHPAFASSLPAGGIAWNVQDIAQYLEWHTSMAEHHAYVTGAAVMRRD